MNYEEFRKGVKNLFKDFSDEELRAIYDKSNPKEKAFFMEMISDNNLNVRSMPYAGNLNLESPEAPDIIMKYCNDDVVCAVAEQSDDIENDKLKDFLFNHPNDRVRAEYVRNACREEFSPEIIEKIMSDTSNVKCAYIAGNECIPSDIQHRLMKEGDLDILVEMVCHNAFIEDDETICYLNNEIKTNSEFRNRICEDEDGYLESKYFEAFLDYANEEQRANFPSEEFQMCLSEICYYLTKNELSISRLSEGDVENLSTYEKTGYRFVTDPSEKVRISAVEHCLDVNDFNEAIKLFYSDKSKSVQEAISKETARRHIWEGWRHIRHNLKNPKEVLCELCNSEAKANFVTEKAVQDARVAGKCEGIDLMSNQVEQLEEKVQSLQNKNSKQSERIVQLEKQLADLQKSQKKNASVKNVVKKTPGL